MIVGNGRVFAQNPDGDWQEIGRTTGIRRVDERVPLPAPVQILDGIEGPAALAWLRETVRTQIVVAVDPAGPDLSAVTALHERRYADVRIEGRTAPTLGVRPPTGKLRELDVERPDGRMDAAVIRPRYRTRADHSRARTRRAALQRRDRRRARTGRGALGPYAATTVSVYLPRARIEIQAPRMSMSEAVTAIVRAATMSMSAAGEGIARAVAAMSRVRLPETAAFSQAVRQSRLGGFADDGLAPAEGALSLAQLMRGALERRATCPCDTCRSRRAIEAGLGDELRAVPLTTERITSFDPPETHHDRIVEDDETGAVRLDSSGRGGSWTDFMARIDELVDGDG